MAAIRQATAEDAPAIGDIFLAARKASMGWLPQIHTDDDTRAWLAGPMMRDCRVWVSGTPVVGFIALHGGTIDHLYVAPAAQGHRIGTALLRHAQTMADRLRLFVFVRNEGAARFYRRHGFRVIAEGDGSTNEEGEPDFEMEWVR